MSIIFHTANLGFSGTQGQRADLLLEDIAQEKPDLVVISGDFVQRHDKASFRQAQKFLSDMGRPVLSVPGSGDLPFLNVAQRFYNPLSYYRGYIGPLPDMVHEGTDCFVVGINTARALPPHLHLSMGAIAQEQIITTHNHFRAAPDDKARLFVCAHPMVQMGGVFYPRIVWGSTDMMEALRDQAVDVILSGAGPHVVRLATPLHDQHPDYPVMVGAPPALPNTRSKERDGYNILRITPDAIEINLIQRNGDARVVLERQVIARKTRENSASGEG